ncbi:hypothetical protein EJ05DRAFT_521863 [Pseudovirgaria hyperparasitica]|uniref:Uncharacterized protein n=1 Tax=Pseudovirgaria hyperparasitica TaxID=470096 RepID=A0A6A6WHQ3_9PEZI|nr:uncharacterized protein EJ05DRAFT_521863 [Pseudovirgaria hyperparasitica]KAF2761625.1 hypothetical protein EJ05DRAFT_521863 [Pseudovirgaria hyperparasitica]
MSSDLRALRAHLAAYRHFHDPQVIRNLARERNSETPIETPAETQSETATGTATEISTETSADAKAIQAYKSLRTIENCSKIVNTRIPPRSLSNRGRDQLATALFCLFRDDIPNIYFPIVYQKPDDTCKLSYAAAIVVEDDGTRRVLLRGAPSITPPLEEGLYDDKRFQDLLMEAQRKTAVVIGWL